MLKASFNIGLKVVFGLLSDMTDGDYLQK